MNTSAEQDHTLHTFYTRRPGLAPLRALIEQHADLSYSRADLARVLEVVNEYCAVHHPAATRYTCFAPMVLGNTPVNHTPPHLLFATYAIYLDLMGGSPEPVPFLSAPLSLNATTALRISPEAGFLLKAPLGSLAPLTDFLVVIPGVMDAATSQDTYGLPPVREGVRFVGCHGGAQASPEAMFGGQLYLHQASRTVLSPWSSCFTEAEERLFFTQPVNRNKVTDYQEVNAAAAGVPMGVLEHNHIVARRVLEACLAGA